MLSNDPDLILEDDDPSDTPPSAPEPAPWRILIVDDDVDVHVVTKFALSSANFQGRRLSFLHAYSGKEALAILRDTPDVAMMLLDVIMETDDAGLRVARQVREELHNDLVRIVLRTGQPGQAFEHGVIVDYDINDYWCKADLTTRKLFTTVISSLRAYAALAAAKATRDRLNEELARARNVQAALNPLALILTLDRDGVVTDANERLCAVFGVTRDAVVGRTAAALRPEAVTAERGHEIVSSLVRSGGWAGDIELAGAGGAPVSLRCAALAFKDSDGLPYQYVAVATERIAAQ
ncbi:PAS domain-containing protein [Massilia sp. GCM10020059]|uniref:PAS domain-containing protein n=1 Tax=Massilia agrisoli TaxID=2892444 RepID=A0ABS8IVU1_9BURK|nr:PAS domain-containing protein [Massilia agrisoli]MCC6072046.1 PAS domain-containing protein [Massilia agrisoli]